MTEEQQQALPSPQSEQKTNAARQARAEHDQEQDINEGEQEANNYERVRAYLVRYPEAKDRDIAGALTMSTSTAYKWRKRVQEGRLQSEQNASSE